MIGKTIIGRSFKGCINYNLSKVEKGLGEILECRGVRNIDRATMIRDFNSRKNLNHKLSRCVWHTALSFQDKLDNERILEIAKEWMEGMNLLTTQYVILRHTDTKHHHVHIVANRINDDGNTVSDSQNWKRSEELCKVIVKKNDLTPVPEQRDEARIDISKLKGWDLLKSEIGRVIKKVISESHSLEDFSVSMNTKGFNCLIKTNPDGSVRGVSFERNGIKIKASDIHKSLSAKNIIDQIKINSSTLLKKESNSQNIGQKDEKELNRGMRLR